MKYMTFNNSCSFAGLANLLEVEGVETDDRSIALDLNLPWIFLKNQDSFISGSMIQGAYYFNLYLNKFGYSLYEQTSEKNELINIIKKRENVMFGIRLENGQKHAVISKGFRNGIFKLLNNRRFDEEKEYFNITENELRNMLDKETIYGYLIRENISDLKLNENKKIMVNLMQESVKNLKSLKESMQDELSQELSKDDFIYLRDRMLRSLVLDAGVMFKISGKKHLENLTEKALREIVRIMQETKDREDKFTLSDYLDKKNIYDLIESWIEEILKKLQVLNNQGNFN